MDQPASDLETDPRFPSGRWTGYFLQPAIPGKHVMELILTFRHGEDNCFRVQRFGFPDELPHMIQYVSGVERFKQMLRGSA